MGVYKRGDIYWISFSVGGRQFRESAQTSRKNEAEALLAKRRVELFEGTHFPEKRKQHLTIGDLRALWLQHAANKKSIATDKARFRRIVEHFGGSTRIAGLLPADVERFKTELQATPTRHGTLMTPATVNRHLELFRAALGLAQRNGHGHRNPMAGVKMLVHNNERDRFCTPDEYERLCDAANPKLRLVIVLGYCTAMRLGEICDLEWDRVDLERPIISLKTSKTGEGRNVPLSREAVEALNAWPRRPDGRVIGTKATAMSPLFTRLCRRLSIEDLHFHDLRHTCATNLRRAGVDVVVLKKLLGHKTWKMMERYQTVDDEDLLAAVGRSTKRQS